MTLISLMEEEQRQVFERRPKASRGQRQTSLRDQLIQTIYVGRSGTLENARVDGHSRPEGTLNELVEAASL